MNKLKSSKVVSLLAVIAFYSVLPFIGIMYVVYDNLPRHRKKAKQKPEWKESDFRHVRKETTYPENSYEDFNDWSRYISHEIHKKVHHN